MQIVINISEPMYHYITSSGTLGASEFDIVDAIRNGVILPSGHGRLIDADKYKKNLKWNENIDNAPTIVEKDN